MRPRHAAGPERRCALTRAHRSKEALIRFVLGPDSTVVPDLAEKLPGRGVWLTAAHEIVSKAVERKVFSRAFKANAKASDGLSAQVGARLGVAALGALAMANKAGAVVFGFTKVEEALRDKVPGSTLAIALIHAADAAEDGCRKLDAKARKATAGSGLPAVRIFTSDELSLASGRPNVVHAALIQGGAAQKFLAAASRAERYRHGISAFVDRDGLDTDQE